MLKIFVDWMKNATIASLAGIEPFTCGPAIPCSAATN
jgi:hypothetical protein